MSPIAGPRPDDVVGSYYQSGIDDSGPYLILAPPGDAPPAVRFAGAAWSLAGTLPVPDPGGYWPSTALALPFYRLSPA